MTPNKILLTGATGFIGTRLCERLKLLHHLPYRAIVRNFTRANRIARLDAEMFAGDLMKPDSIAKALEGCDCVIHMAHGDDATGPTETKNLIAAALAAKVKRFVHLSSMAVHGPKPGPECAREDTAVIGRYNSTYSDSKAEVEELVQKSIQRDGLPAVILRPTIVFGPYSGFVMSVMNAARSGEISLIDDGTGLCNAVFVDDVCSAIHAALTADAGVGEAFFVNADEAVPWREFNLTFAKMVNPAVKVTNFNSAEVIAYWAAHKPTFRSNVKAFARLLASPEFHRYLSTVPALRDAIRWTKQTLKKNLSGETVVALKRTGGGAGGAA
ncbi:MAG: NAD(P)-dependent oxidoreductase, partial [Verrucomicrobia bacterium]|nr:NAD(P)-dependent oxidoreductase [Verrucomicrobiota bacterium]